jgi:O-antigen ligase
MEWLLGGYIWLFIHRPFEIWPTLGVIQLERAYMLLCILAWVFYPKKCWIRNRLSVAFLFFTAVLVTSWLLSPHGELGVETVETQVKIFVFYVLLLTTIRDERSFRRILAIYLGCVALLMLHSLYEYANGRHQFRMGITRMCGMGVSHADPNTFAATLLYSLPLTLPFWRSSDRLSMRALLLGYQGLSLLCIILTGSRGALVGLCCYLCLLVGFSPQRFKLAFVFLFLIPLIGISIPGPLQNRFLTIVDPEVGPANAQESASGRWLGFVNGIKLWSERPLTGYGPHSFGTAVGNGFQAHNLYGQTLGELGTLGALGLLAIVAAFAGNALEARRHRHVLPSTSFVYQTSRAIGFVVVLLLVLGCGSHNLYRFTWVWFGAFQAIALHCLRSPEPAEEAGEPEFALQGV